VAIFAGAASRRSIGPGGVPTMDVNDNAYFLNKRVALESIASNRASTGCSYIPHGGFLFD
jgi:hypothetical protein